MNPRYPVYIISKGRADRRLTIRTLDALAVPYTLVVEPQEFDDYARHVDPSRIVTTPFSNLGQGSIPVRNFVWEHSISRGARRHWILDDNIAAFCRLNNNLQVKVTDGTGFRVMEDFVDRYSNVAIAGPQYDHFAKSKCVHPAFCANTRVYSCLLIDNALKHRWRGRYNEDTDLCLRVLKDGLCTLLFYAFTQEKATTMTMRGGNTDELYKDDGRLLMAQSLVDQHPDVARVSWKFNRWQHHVDYRPFRSNALKYRDGYTPPSGVNEYGMRLVSVEEPSLFNEQTPCDARGLFSR